MKNPSLRLSPRAALAGGVGYGMQDAGCQSCCLDLRTCSGALRGDAQRGDRDGRGPRGFADLGAPGVFSFNTPSVGEWGVGFERRLFYYSLYLFDMICREILLYGLVVCSLK